MSHVPSSLEPPMEFGGYMDISGNTGERNPFYPGGMLFNSGRACLEFLLRQRGYHITGVDTNAEQVAALCAQGRRVFTPDALPDGERHDYILMSHVIEHMTPDELVACMDRYLPFLKDDGRLIIITPFPGERFWHDFTHVRPYLPQSVRMAFGGIIAPSSGRTAHRMELEEIFFFKDSWRVRNCRAFYPFSATSGLIRKALWLCNVFLAFLHQVSGGRLGVTASWLGVYTRSTEF